MKRSKMPMYAARGAVGMTPEMVLLFFFNVITSLEIRLVGVKYIRRKFYWLWVRQPNKLPRRET